jgi:predicted dehydrogenase
MYRNTPHNKPQWTRSILPDMTAENIIWKSFLGEAPPHEFDPNRYINWRFFWDYSGGNFYENMCHQLAIWYKVLNLRIPSAVTTVGGIYLWKDGREVPDTMSVNMQHTEELLFTWDSGFGNSALGITEHVLGTDGTIINASEMDGPIRYEPQKANRPQGAEIEGHRSTPVTAHMQNFLDCIRSGKEPNCPFELGYRVAIATRMSVDSYRQGRTLRWDTGKEEIV